MFVLAIWLQLAPPLVEASHLTITPLFPFTVKVPLFELEHTVDTEGEIVAPSGEGVTVTVTFVLLEHPFAAVPVKV